MYVHALSYACICMCIHSYMCLVNSRESERGYIAIITYLATITLCKVIKGREKRVVSVGVIAQWQSIGSLSQRPWVQFLAAPLCHFNGLRTCSNSPDYLSLDDLSQSLDLGEAQSIGLSML